VKPSDLGEYEANAMEKAKYTIYTSKHQLPLKLRQITSSPSKQAIWMANIIFWTQEGSNQNTRFLNAKDRTPPKSKANQTNHQIQPKTPTPPEVENTRFHQLSLDTPQDKHRPLKQQNKSMHIWPRHKSHKSKNNHQRSQATLTRHPQQEKCGPPQQLISK
jgi:hypothetical protein